MNETLKRLGGELRRVFAGQLSRPLNWRMIDRLVSLEEADEKHAASMRHCTEPKTGAKTVAKIAKGDTCDRSGPDPRLSERPALNAGVDGRPHNSECS